MHPITIKSVTPVHFKDGKTICDTTRIVNKTFDNKTVKEIEAYYCEALICDDVMLHCEMQANETDIKHYTEMGVDNPTQQQYEEMIAYNKKNGINLNWKQYKKVIERSKE